MAGVQNIMTAKYQAAHPKSCICGCALQKGTKQTHATNLTKSSGIRSIHFKGNRHKSDIYITVRTTEKLSAYVFLNIKINTEAHKTSSTHDFSYNGNPGLWQKEILTAMFWRIHRILCDARKLM
jgi:hypothetical protein